MTVQDLDTAGLADEDRIYVQIPTTCWRNERSIVIANRTLAKRAHRDDAVRLADDVRLIQGKFPSRGGSQQRPVLVGSAYDREKLPQVYRLQVIEVQTTVEMYRHIVDEYSDDATWSLEPTPMPEERRTPSW